ncbi:hypothetical protein PFISCL1PPCAC_25662, partial [Pristionchus fissidentatus]
FHDTSNLDSVSSLHLDELGVAFDAKGQAPSEKEHRRLSVVFRENHELLSNSVHIETSFAPAPHNLMNCLETSFFGW